MKDTGIVRRLDELGRITLPMELRKTLNLTERDSFQIFVEGDRIILQKYAPSDVFTGSMDDLVSFHGKNVSKSSVIQLAELMGLTISE